MYVEHRSTILLFGNHMHCSESEPNHCKVGGDCVLQILPIITVVCGLHSEYEETCSVQMQMPKIFIPRQFVSYLYSQGAKKFHADYGVQICYGLLAEWKNC
jgi:hypothetical protein